MSTILRFCVQDKKFYEDNNILYAKSSWLWVIFLVYVVFKIATDEYLLWYLLRFQPWEYGGFFLLVFCAAGIEGIRSFLRGQRCLSLSSFGLALALLFSDLVGTGLGTIYLWLQIMTGLLFAVLGVGAILFFRYIKTFVVWSVLQAIGWFVAFYFINSVLQGEEGMGVIFLSIFSNEFLLAGTCVSVVMLGVLWGVYGKLVSAKVMSILKMFLVIITICGLPMLFLSVYIHNELDSMIEFLARRNVFIATVYLFYIWALPALAYMFSVYFVKKFLKESDFDAHIVQPAMMISIVLVMVGLLATTFLGW